MTGVLVAIQSHGDIVKLIDATVSDLEPTPSAALAAYTLDTAGVISQSTVLGTTNLGAWLVPSGNRALYEVFATLNSGSLSSGSTGSWLNLGSSRSWQCQVSPGPGSKNADLSLQLRLVGTVAVLATAHVVLSAVSA